MRQGGPNGRRPRGRHHGGGHHGGHGGHERHHGGNGLPPGGMGMNMNRPRSAASLRHQSFDSHCLDVRVRGNAWQVYEKYQQLARDASGGGDRVSAENYLQHAEHYFRIIEAINEATAAEQRQRGVTPSPFGDQPSTPNNYYGADGNLAAAPGAQPDGSGGPTAPVAGGQGQQAEVTQRQPQNPFLSPEDSDERQGPEPLVARR
jgi:Domain of unknown function (DUF4167)